MRIISWNIVGIVAAVPALGGLGGAGCVTQGKYDKLLAKHKAAESLSAQRQRRIESLSAEITLLPAVNIKKFK